MTALEKQTSTSFAKVFARLTIGTGLIFSIALATVVLFHRSSLRDQLIERDAWILQSVIEAQFEASDDPDLNEINLTAVALNASELRSVFAINLFYPLEDSLQKIPETLISVPLTNQQKKILNKGISIQTFHPELVIDSLFVDFIDNESGEILPAIEILIPVDIGEHLPNAAIQFWLDGSTTVEDYKKIDSELLAMAGTMISGSAVILGLIFILARKQILRLIAEVESQNQSLLESQNALIKSAKATAIGSVSGHLVHGIRNPLIGLRELLRSEPHETTEALNLVNRMDGILSESISFIQQNESLAKIDFSIEELKQSIEDRFANSAQKAGQELKVTISGKANINGRSFSIVLLILRNLIDNAIQASPDGSVVCVDLQCSQKNINVQVKDFGSGMPDSIANTLFQSSQSSKPKGTGIGLNLSASLAKSIGGSLQLVSNTGSLTTFSLSFPI